MEWCVFRNTWREAEALSQIRKKGLRVLVVGVREFRGSKVRDKISAAFGTA